jgi:hypothetical protein
MARARSAELGQEWAYAHSWFRVNHPVMMCVGGSTSRRSVVSAGDGSLLCRPP